MHEELPEELKEYGANLAEEIRLGSWDGKYDKQLPVPQSKIILRELETRCPGYSNEEYKSAIAYGLFVTR